MISPSKRQHKRALKPLDLELHRRLARRNYWQRRLLYCGLTALAASLAALLAGAPWQLRLLCVLGGFLCGFAWPLESMTAKSLTWFDAHLGLSYRTAVERSAAQGDPYGFTEAVKERAREATARLELPPAQPWWLPLVALALGLALLPVLHLNLGGPQLPSLAQPPSPHQQAASGSPQQNALTPPPQGRSAAPASAPHAKKTDQGASKKAKGSAGGARQRGSQNAAQGGASSGGDSAAGSEAGALSQFARQVRQSAPAASTQSGAQSGTQGGASSAPSEQTSQANPSSQAASPSSQSSQGQPSQSQTGQQGQEGQEDVGRQSGQSGNQSGNQSEGSGQQAQNGQQAQESSQGQGRSQQGGAQSPQNPGAHNKAASQQGKAQQQGSSGQQSSTSQQSAQGESQGQQKGGQDQASRTLTQGEQGSRGTPGATSRGAMSQQTGRDEGTGSQQLQGEAAGGRSGNGAGNHSGNADKAQSTPLGPPSGPLTYLPGEVTNGATTKSGKVLQPGALPNTLPQGSAPSGYNHALEQAITEGRIPVEYQQILRNYFQ